MRKKKQTTPKDMSLRGVKGKRGKVAASSEKPVDEVWQRLMQIREELGKPGKAGVPSEKSDEVWERLMKRGEELSKGWESEKSAVEILSEMRR